MSTIYTYTISTDTANGLCDAAALQLEIQESSIQTQLEGISCFPDQDLIRIIFAAPLSGPDETTLTAVVAAHTGEPIDQGSVAPAFDSTEIIGLVDVAVGQSFSGKVIKKFDTLAANSNLVLFNWDSVNDTVKLVGPGFYFITLELNFKLDSGYYKSGQGYVEVATSADDLVYTSYAQLPGGCGHDSLFHSIYSPFGSTSIAVPYQTVEPYSKVRIRQVMEDYYPAYPGTLSNPADSCRLTIMRIRGIA